MLHPAALPSSRPLPITHAADSRFLIAVASHAGQRAAHANVSVTACRSSMRRNMECISVAAACRRRLALASRNTPHSSIPPGPVCADLTSSYISNHISPSHAVSRCHELDEDCSPSASQCRIRTIIHPLLEQIAAFDYLILLVGPMPPWIVVYQGGMRSLCSDAPPLSPSL